MNEFLKQKYEYCSICDKAYNTNYMHLVNITDTKLEFEDELPLLQKIHLLSLWNKLTNMFKNMKNMNYLEYDNYMKKISLCTIYTQDELLSCLCERTQALKKIMKNDNIV